MHIAAFDVTASTRESLISLLKDWTEAIASLTQGREIGRRRHRRKLRCPAGRHRRSHGPGRQPPDLTIGFGRTLFEKDGKDRFGLAGKLPEALIDLPHFPRRRARGGTQRRRPDCPGLRRRSAGGRACRAQPGQDRLWPGARALVPDRLRPYVLDLHHPGDAAEPLRLQGRHRKPQAGKRRPRQPARVGRAMPAGRSRG